MSSLTRAARNRNLWVLLRWKEVELSIPALGIDVSKKKLDLALLKDGKYKHKVCANSPEGHKEMLGWIERQGASQVHALLEATGGYEESAATALAEAGHLVSVVNPYESSRVVVGLNPRNKTDKVDAKGLAHYCELQRSGLSLWRPKPPEYRELERLIRRREAVIEMRTQEENRLQAPTAGTEETRLIEEHLTYLNKQVEELDHLIKDHIDRHPGLKSADKLLQSIPGVGPVTSAYFLAEVAAHLDRLNHPKKVVAYCGVSVKHRESGSSVRGRSTLSKFGNRQMRKALYMAAKAALRSNPVIKALGERLEAKGKPYKVCVGAAMRKLLHVMCGVLKHQTRFQAQTA